MTSNLEPLCPGGPAGRRALRRLLWLAGACGLVLLTVGAAPRTRGYLPRVGPAPLRYQVPRPPMILTLLPPLKMGEPPPDPPKTEPKKPEQMVPASSPAKKVAAVPARTPAGAETNSAAGPPLAADSPNESLDGSPIFNNAGQPVIQPQRLVRFFQSPGTNGGSDVHLAVPDGFTPPGAAARPSSGAAYISK